MGFTNQLPRAADFILSEANGELSRQVVVISASAGILQAGQLLSVLTAANAATVTPKVGGNTGNGAVGTVTVSSEAITGTYVVRIIGAAANGGEFEVIDPTGDTVGDGLVGEAFQAGGLSFTIADGSTDFAVGDAWNVAIKAGLGEYVAYDDDGTDDGRRTASGVLYAAVDATVHDVKATAIVRQAEVAGELLIGLDAAGRVDLAANGVIVRE
ncbi:Uncharacterised protein [Bordetella ansorpii]|uniref:Head decoration protein n=1 Tax=Bordetella ansorpii TaxID=288768 RepID=A0A157RLT6_9BORD|nr:head decoration protein [Bordetella ansorpii]SAI58938.1 Uncharacterised protein [Bordetella ansorpii]